MIEVYVDDYITLAIPRCKADLDHLSNATMHGVHSIFPPDEDDEEDAIAFKKLKRGDGKWMIRKDELGWTFDGRAKTMELEQEKVTHLLATLNNWTRTGKRGIPFKEFHSTTMKVKHAAKGIPAAHGLFTEINRVVRVEPKTVHIRENSNLHNVIRGLRTLLREAHKEPTKCKQLVAAHPDIIGIMDAAKEGTGGVVFGERDECVPTVFRLEWPKEVQQLVCTHDNPNGPITNSDLEMAGFLICWLVVEAVAPTLTHKHVGLFCDNSPTISWVERMATRSSKVAGFLLMALAIRMKECKASPLTPLHIAGKQNSIGDIPSRSFGGTPEWHCKTDDEFLTLFNSKFPLPNKQSWKLYHLPKGIITRVISVLQMKGSEMGEWRRLPKRKTNTTDIGVPIANLWELTLHWRNQPPHSPQKSEPSRDSARESEADTTATDAKWQLERYLRQSRPLVRRYPWTQE
jgi:hypothetical protein